MQLATPEALATGEPFWAVVIWLFVIAGYALFVLLDRRRYI